MASTLRANDHGGFRGDGADTLIPNVAGTLGGGDGKRGWANDLDRSGAFIPMAFTQNTRDEVRFINGDGQIAGALAAQPGAKQTNYIAFGGNNTSGPIQVATALNAHGGAGRMDFESETFLHQVSSAGNDGREPTYGVRRLMPVECERLQGFSDGWTEYTDTGERQADGTRYRQLGNAVAVPVAEWLGHRIKKFLR